jgi:hypothetical protein
MIAQQTELEARKVTLPENITSANALEVFEMSAELSAKECTVPTCHMLLAGMLVGWLKMGRLSHTRR